MKKNTSTLKKIFGYIGHYKYLLFLSVLLAGGSFRISGLLRRSFFVGF